MESYLEQNIYKKIFKIALPISVQGVISSTLGLVDNIMVGNLGEASIAAVGIGLQIFFIHYLILFGFTGGCATFIAQFYGANDRVNIRKTMGFAITVAFVVGILLCGAIFLIPETIISFYTKDQRVMPYAIQYMQIGAPTILFLGISIPVESALKAIQKTNIPLYIAAIAFTTNTVMNYMLIFGKFGFPKLGIAGAAIATVISRFIEMSAVLYVIFGRDTILKGRLRDYFGWSREFVSRVWKNARVTTLNELLWSLGVSAYTAAYAKIGITAYAAFQAAASINNIFYFGAFSIGDAALILLGQQLGENNLDKSKDLAKKMLKIALVMGTVSGVLLLICAFQLLDLYSFTPLGHSLAEKLLFVFAANMIFHLINGVFIVGILRAGGDTTYAMVAESASVWLVGVPLAFLGSLVLDLPIYYAVLLTNMSELVKLVFLYRRFLSGKWIKNVIEGL